MISIKNTQRTYAIDLVRVRKSLHIVLGALGYQDFDLGVWFTTNATIRKYNRQYRHKDAPTDILSFSFYPELKAGDRIKAEVPDEKVLGDLIISVEYVQNMAHKLGVDINDRIQLLLVHGVCHLLGYDHEADADYKKMRRKEQWLLRTLKKHGL